MLKPCKSKTCLAFSFIIYMKKVKVDTEKAGFVKNVLYQVGTVDEKHHGMWVCDDYGDPVFLSNDEIEEEIETNE